ncbi:MAG: ribosome biogenesis GTPase YlqF [Gammaproteobacteria bacterium]
MTVIMPINWYPGHMHKASKEMQTLLDKCHVFLEILDARCPGASSNPLRAELHKLKPHIRILSKCDLAEDSITRNWQAFFDKQTNSTCLLSSLEQPPGREHLLAIAESMTDSTPAASAAFEQKLIVIAGIPNVGKSTLLNSWMGRKLAKTGNEPAITRAQQTVRFLDRWHLVDTPGLLWPKLEDQEGAQLMAALGSIRQTAIDEQEVAWHLAARLLRSHYPLLTTRYDLDGEIHSVEALFSAIAVHRGAQRHGRPDLHKVAQILLQDLRSGRLGRISMEHPPGSWDSDWAP